MTTPLLKRALQALACAALLSGLVSPALAQGAWPAKPIRIIVPFPAGGPTDITARVVGQAMGESLKTPVVVENKSGAHGFIGVSEAARSPADGYTLMMASIGTRPNQSTDVNPTAAHARASKPYTGCMIMFFHTSALTVGMTKKGAMTRRMAALRPKKRRS